MVDKTIPQLDPVVTPAATDRFGVRQAGDTEDKRQTRAQVHALESGEHLLLPTVDEPATPTLAFGDGDTGFYQPADNVVRFASGGSHILAFSVSGMQMENSSGAIVVNETPAAANPVFVPNKTDLDTGIGSSGFDNLSLIAGGIEIMRMTEGAVEQAIVSPGALLGTVALPSLAFGDGDSGFFEDADDSIVTSIAGVEQMNIAADGKLFVNTITGTGADGSNIVSATPQPVVMYAAGSDTNGVDGANFDIWAGYAAGLDPANGGDVRIWGGGGGGGPAIGGHIRLFGGEADASPGDIFLTGGVATVGGSGGGINIAGGDGFGTGARAGGDVGISGGDATGTGAGGDIGLTGGTGATTGLGGNITLTPGTGVSGNGGLMLINGGAVSTSGNGGRIQLLSGDGGGVADPGGDLWFLVGQGNGTGAAGNIYFNTTNGSTPAVSVATDAVGDIVMFGIGGNSIDGGDILITAGGSSLGATGDGGDISLAGGTTTATNGDGGDVILAGGSGNGSGTDGDVIATGRLRSSVAGSGALIDENTTQTNPTIVPDWADEDTGLGAFSGDTPSMVAGGVEAMRWAEASSSIIVNVQADVGLTADVGSAQGNGVIISSYNVYSTVANAGDAATLPSNFAVGQLIYVKNDGANSMDVFPASGDDAGAGTNVAVAVAAGDFAVFMGTVSSATWTKIAGGTA